MVVERLIRPFQRLSTRDLPSKGQEERARSRQVSLLLLQPRPQPSRIGTPPSLLLSRARLVCYCHSPPCYKGHYCSRPLRRKLQRFRCCYCIQLTLTYVRGLGPSITSCKVCRTHSQTRSKKRRRRRRRLQGKGGGGSRKPTDRGL